MSESSDKINEAVESVKGKITEFAENEKVQDAVGTAKEKFGEIKDKLLGK